MDNMEALGITVGDITVVGILGIAALMGTALGLVKAVLFVASCWRRGNFLFHLSGRHALFP